MSIAVGTQIRIIEADFPMEDEGYMDGAVGTVIEGDERLNRLIDLFGTEGDDTEFIVRFTETTDGEAFYFKPSEEGSIWERV